MVTWKVDVKVGEDSRYKATGTRTDDVTGAVESYWLAGILNPKLTAEDQIAAIRDGLWKQHEEAVAKVAAAAARAGTLAVDVAAALDAKEK